MAASKRLSPRRAGALMMVAGLLALPAGAVIGTAGGQAGSSAPASILAAPGPAAPGAPILIAFRHSFGGGGFLHRRSGFGGFGRPRRHRFLRTIGKTLFYTYLLHLFFSSGAGSLLIWLLIIGLVAYLVSRRRRRRLSY